MIIKLFTSGGKTLFNSFDKRAANSIQKHFRLSNYQMLFLIWIKGIWTGILLSLVLHYLIKH